MQYTESVVDCPKGMAQEDPTLVDWQTTYEEVKKALGFHRVVTPHQTTIQRLFRKLHPDEVETAFRHMFLHIFEKDQEERGAYALSIDGKAQRGRLKFEEDGGAYPVHAVSIVDHQTGVVLTQGHVEQDEEKEKSEQNTNKVKNKQSAKKAKKKKQNSKKTQREQEEDKAKSELAVASLLVKLIDWKGKVL